MKDKNRFWSFVERLFFFNQILRAGAKIKKKSPRLAFLVACSLIILASIFWTGILWSAMNFPVLLTHPPYPESQVPEECLYETATPYLVDWEGRVHDFSCYAVRNPTYAEMKKFLEEDKTNQNEYILGKYVCWNFAIDLVDDATEKGIRAGFVRVDFPIQSAFYENKWASSHAIVCFDTTDKGLIFVESITDEEVRIVVGKSYWRGIVGKNLWEKINNAWDRFTNNKNPFFIYNGTTYVYDDTVQSVGIYWNGEPLQGVKKQPAEVKEQPAELTATEYQEVTIDELFDSLYLERDAEGLPFIKSAYKGQEVVLKIILSNYRIDYLNSRFEILISEERNVLIKGGGEEIKIPVKIYAEPIEDVSQEEVSKWDKTLSEESSKEVSIYGKVNFFGWYYDKDQKKTDVSKFTSGTFSIDIYKIGNVYVNYQ